MLALSTMVRFDCTILWRELELHLSCVNCDPHDVRNKTVCQCSESVSEAPKLSCKERVVFSMEAELIITSSKSGKTGTCKCQERCDLCSSGCFDFKVSKRVTHFFTSCVGSSRPPLALSESHGIALLILHFIINEANTFETCLSSNLSFIYLFLFATSHFFRQQLVDFVFLPVFNTPSNKCSNVFWCFDH